MALQIADELARHMGNPIDLAMQPLTAPQDGEPSAALIYLTSITDQTKVNQQALDPVLDIFAEWSREPFPIWERIHETLGNRGDTVGKQLNELESELFAGKCLFVADALPQAFAIDIANWNNRAVTNPENEQSLIGPKDSFIEDLKTNLSLIRRRIRHKNLVVHDTVIGTKSNTSVAFLYMKDLVNETALEQLNHRLQTIELDILLDSSQLARLLLGASKWATPFPLFQSTERPDKSVSAIMEGRILMLVDSTPMAAIVPATITALYQTPDDYYFPNVVGTFIRWVRFFGLLLTVFLPGLYIALTSVNQGVLRIQLMLAISASREGVPYPAFIEVLIMLSLVELINEATVRLPKAIGGTATIVGGLIIGTAAAESHLISNIMIVITAAVAIGSFTAPNYSIGIAWRICSYIMVLLAIPLGLFGMAMGTALILMYFCHLKSMGVPYMAPFNTSLYRDLIIDGLIRIPKRLMKKNPSTYSGQSSGKSRLDQQRREDNL